MARIPKGPWWWEQKQQYAVRIKGKRYLLGPNKAKATTRFHELMANPEPPPPKVEPSGLAVCTMIDLFLTWTETERAALTFTWYQKHLQSFLDSLADQRMPAVNVEPHQVETWANSQGWGDSTRRGGLTAVARAFSWALKKGHINNNPIRGRIDKPPAGKRERWLTPEEFDEVLKHVKGHFEDLLITAWETGARPQEIVRVEARHVDLESGRWVFPVDESKGKKEKRIVYLSEKALAITERLMRKNKTGPLFLTQYGNPWTRYSTSDAFERLKAKVGTKYRLYDFRFSFCTNGLKNGVDPVTMQKLMGHKDLSMISKVYALVGQDHAYMRKAAMQASQRMRT